MCKAQTTRLRWWFSVRTQFSCVQGSITSGGFPIVSAELLPQPCMSWPSMYILATARRGPNGGLVLPKLLMCNSIIHPRNSQQTQIEWITSQPLSCLPYKKVFTFVGKQKKYQQGSIQLCYYTVYFWKTICFCRHRSWLKNCSPNIKCLWLRVWICFGKLLQKKLFWKLKICKN